MKQLLSYFLTDKKYLAIFGDGFLSSDLSRLAGWGRPPLPLLLLLFLLLPGCSVLPPLRGPEPPALVRQPEETRSIDRREVPEEPLQPPPTVQAGPARSLYEQAQAALASGQAAQAEMLLERALRIEPRNPFYWYLLGQCKYAQGDFAQAVQFCRKSESLAGDNSQLRRSNRILIEQAERKR